MLNYSKVDELINSKIYLKEIDIPISNGNCCRWNPFYEPFYVVVLGDIWVSLCCWIFSLSA